MAGARKRKEERRRETGEERSAPTRGVRIGLISTEDCACVEKGASAIAPREQRRKRKRNLSFPIVISRSSRRRGTGRRPGKTSGILLAEAGWAPVYDTVIPTPALARTSGSPSCPARVRSRGELDFARHRHRRRGTGKNGAGGRKGGQARYIGTIRAR